MVIPNLILLISICLSTIAAEGTEEPSQGTPEVNAPNTIFTNFRIMAGDEFLNLTKSDESADGIISYFGAEWCGHCKKLKPIFMNMSNEALERKSGAKPLFIYHPVEKGNDHAAKMFRVSGYPTIIYIRKGKWLEYDGVRNESLIWEWLDEQKAGGLATGKEYPSRLPTAWEDITEGFENTKKMLAYQYQSNTLVFLGIIIIFLVVMFLCCSVTYQLFTEAFASNEPDHVKKMN